MKEAGADGRSWEDHLATARLNGEAKAAAPQVGHGLGADKACAMSTEEDEEKDKGCNLAVKLEESVEAISPPFEVRGRISEEKGSSMEERPLNMDEEKTCNFLVESAESGNLQTCYGANGRVLSKALCITCGDTLCSKDVGCVRGSVDKVTERSQYELGGLVCNGGLSDSIKHDADRCPNGVDDIIFMTDDNYELSQDDLMLKIEAEASGQLLEDSVPSVSGSIDVSLNGKAGQCEEDVLCNGALGKTSLEDVQLRCMKPHCGDGSLPDPVKFDIQQLPHDMDVTRLKKYVNQLDEDGLLQKLEQRSLFLCVKIQFLLILGLVKYLNIKQAWRKWPVAQWDFLACFHVRVGFGRRLLKTRIRVPGWMRKQGKTTYRHVGWKHVMGMGACQIYGRVTARTCLVVLMARV